MPRVARPSLYRTIKVVMTDGSTFRIPAAMRTVSETVQLERDPANHPAYSGSNNAATLMSRREEARLERFRRRTAASQQIFED